MNSKTALVISLVLLFPLFFMVITATLGYEPPFVGAWLENPDNTPNVAGRIVMLVALFGVPAAFVFNLLPMLNKRAETPTAPYTPTRTHIFIGSVVLLAVVALLSHQVLGELNQLVRSMGSAAVVIKGLALIAMLILPVLFMLNRLPALPVIKMNATSASLIVGAAILLVIVMCGSAYMFEEIACQTIPNCD